jgi:hypothetical protein
MVCFAASLAQKKQIVIVTLTGPGFDLETLNVPDLLNGLLSHLLGVPSLHGDFQGYRLGSYSVQLVE